MSTACEEYSFKRVYKVPGKLTFAEDFVPKKQTNQKAHKIARRCGPDLTETPRRWQGKCFEYSRRRIAL